MAKTFDKMFINVIMLGFAFMLIFTAFQTCGMIQQVVIKSITKEHPDYKGDGYTSLAVIYAVFAISNWLAPSIISYIGPKFSMLLGGITYALFVFNFLFNETWGLYAASVLIGVGASVIWTGQGNFLTINSDCDTMSRNSGIFWALMQCSLLFGNIFVFFEFQGKEEIDQETRRTVFGVLLGICCFGLSLLCFLRNNKSTVLEVSCPVKEEVGAKQAFMQAIKIVQTRKMLLLSLTFIYTGLELSFFSGVYGPSVSFTKQLGADSQKYAGIAGIFIGVGEILGGALFGILGKKTNKHGRDPIVLLGYIMHIATFYLIFINLPAKSPFGATFEPSYLKSSVTIAMVCAFGLGFGDACFNTQLYSILGCIYPDDSASAFAIFKFFQSVAAAVAFFYSNQVLLPFQLLILVIVGTIGTISFWLVEWQVYEEKAKEQRSAKYVGMRKRGSVAN